MVKRGVERAELVYAILAFMLVASIYVGANWIQLDRAQMRASRVLPPLNELRRGAFQYPDLFIQLAQVLPGLQALQKASGQLTGDGLNAERFVDSRRQTQELRAHAKRLQEAWLGGRSLQQPQVSLTQAMDTVRAQVVDQVEETRRLKEAKLRQLVWLQMGMLFLVATSVGVGRRNRAAAVNVPNSPLASQGIHRSNVDSLLFPAIPFPVVYSVARQRIVDVNEAFETMTGYRREECLGRNVDFNLSGQQDRRFFREMRNRLAREDRFVGELWLRHRNGEAFADKVLRMVVRGPAQEVVGHITLSTDPTKSDASKQLMLWQAHHDPLTKLPNRNLLEERLARALVNVEWPCAVLSVDLDRFKDLNDSVGPVQGDQVLIAAAHRLAMCARDADTVARIGADHFVILLGGGAAQQEAEAVAASVVQEFRAPFQLMERDYFVSASVGVALFPKDGDSTGELLQQADAARAAVKAAGGDGLGFYRSDISSRAARRLEIEGQLRGAIKRNEFELHLQPILNLGSGCIAGAEALLRWEHPDLGYVSPGEFIPIAESARLIGDMASGLCRRRGVCCVPGTNSSYLTCASALTLALRKFAT